MSEETLKNQGEINRQIDEARERLHELKSVEASALDELKQLTGEQEKYSALAEISDQLDKLEKAGGADLFWGENYDKEVVVEHQQKLKSLIAEFDTRFDQLQNKQNAHGESAESLIAKINILNEESLQLQMQEEEAAEEFVIEREVTKLPFRTLNMPWNSDSGDQREFRKVLLIVLFFTCLLGVLIPMWKIPVPDRIEVVEIPKRLAKLMLAKKAPPPPAKVEKKEPKKEEKKDEKIKEKEVEKKEEKKVEKPKPEKVEQPTPEPVITKRKKVERAGLMAFKDDFADLISDTTSDVKLGSAAKISGKGKVSKAKKATRSLVTATNAGGSSGGINTAALSRNAGGGGKDMESVGFSRVESSIGEGKFAGDDRPLSGDGAVPSRTDEEIQIVFDRYKAALYRIYNRELRKNPTLQGKMVLRLTIEPDGKVSACSVDSSDMDAPTLDEGISSRVKRFKFGAKDGVPTVTILYPIDFLPAS